MSANRFRNLATLTAFLLVAYGFSGRGPTEDRYWLLLLFAIWLLLCAGAWVAIDAGESPVNRSISRIAAILGTLFLAAGVHLGRVQVIRGEETSERTATTPDGLDTLANPRLAAVDIESRRGRIYDRGGALIADSVYDEDNDIWRRVYPAPSSAYVAGYYSPLQFGATGLEDSFDDQLSGRSGINAVDRTIDHLLHRDHDGLDLYLTLDVQLQETAHKLLADRIGAAILIDVKTGAIRALASVPNFNPNAIFAYTLDERTAAQEYWESLLDDDSAPLVLRATNGRYTPGSTFKVITAAAAIEHKVASPDTVFVDDGDLDVDGHIIVENNRPNPAVDEWTMRDGLAYSLNVVFAQVGLQLGVDRLTETAANFGFGLDVPFDLQLAETQIASSGDFLESRPALADTAFGQGQLLATPLLMALVAATIAGDGTTPRPRLVERITTGSGDPVQTFEPSRWQRAVSLETAQETRELMIYAVENGSVWRAAIDGVIVGGKTGTAELEENEPHSWFIGFAETNEAIYATAVILERGGLTTAESVNLGRALLEAAIQTE